MMVWSQSFQQNLQEQNILEVLVKITILQTCFMLFGSILYTK